ncbi:MAG: hypothetical protein AAF479_13700 [Pseudomonadota bacterium]
MDQCKYDKGQNKGNTVVYLENDGDFYLAYGNLERISKEVGAPLEDKSAGRDYVKHPSAQTLSEPSDQINQNEWFGSMLRCCGGTIMLRRSSSSGDHPPTLDLNGISDFKTYADTRSWELTNTIKEQSDDRVRVEIKMMGRMVPYRKGA